MENANVEARMVLFAKIAHGHQPNAATSGILAGGIAPWAESFKDLRQKRWPIIADTDKQGMFMHAHFDKDAPFALVACNRKQGILG